MKFGMGDIITSSEDWDHGGGYTVTKGEKYPDFKVGDVVRYVGNLYTYVTLAYGEKYIVSEVNNMHDGTGTYGIRIINDLGYNVWCSTMHGGQVCFELCQ